jgi:hypothetical protein
VEQAIAETEWLLGHSLRELLNDDESGEIRPIRPLRPVLVLMLEHHTHRTLTNLRRIPPRRLCHDPILSKTGARNIPGAVHPPELKERAVRLVLESPRRLFGIVDAGCRARPRTRC